ncbi:MAG: hypothetical protein ACK2UO_11390, partial [Caldilineaceae bacterium]
MFPPRDRLRGGFASLDGASLSGFFVGRQIRLAGRPQTQRGRQRRLCAFTGRSGGMSQWQELASTRREQLEPLRAAVRWFA